MKLTNEGCRERQKRFTEVLEDKGLDGAIVARREHVNYLSGFLCERSNASALFIRKDGHVTLVAAAGAEGVADEVITYEPSYFSTMHSRHYEDVAAALTPAIPKSGAFGADLGGGAACITNLGGPSPVDLTREIYRLRKFKLPDEVDAIRDAIRITDVMYATAKETLRPGADELDVFAEIHKEAVRAAGGDLEHFGNDFRANEGGGLPRRRLMEAGELYIIDAGPSMDGYFADNCRTFSIDRSPRDAQMKAWSYIDALFPILEAEIRPGLKAIEMFNIANDYFSKEGYNGMIHHLGHGIGLAPHETPELNPEYDAVFEVGDVFTMEPGLYGDDLKAGIRLEENYFITEGGFEKLTSFPRSLV